jgi:small subunit ribosomal protein S16
VLKIRLKRAGGRNHPFYRVVVIDSRKARDSRALEEIGYYNPVENPFVVNVDRERVAYWTERGAQVSDAVKGILRRENSEHPTRRKIEDFTPEEPAEKPKPKKAVKAAEGAVAVATETSPEAKGEEAPPAAEAPATEAASTPAEAAPAETGAAGQGEEAAKPKKTVKKTSAKTTTKAAAKTTAKPKTKTAKMAVSKGDEKPAAEAVRKAETKDEAKPKEKGE